MRSTILVVGALALWGCGADDVTTTTQSGADVTGVYAPTAGGPFDRLALAEGQYRLDSHDCGAASCTSEGTFVVREGKIELTAYGGVVRTFPFEVTKSGGATNDAMLRPAGICIPGQPCPMVPTPQSGELVSQAPSPVQQQTTIVCERNCAVEIVVNGIPMRITGERILITPGAQNPVAAQ